MWLLHKSVSITALCLFIIICASHIITIYIITKGKLTDNRYHLIKWLSLSDGMFAFNGILIFTSTYGEFKTAPVEQFTTAWLYAFTGFSLLLTVLISADRFCAVQFCLRYNEIVTKKTLNILIAAIFFTNLSIVIALLFLNAKRVGVWAPPTVPLVIYIACLRTVACSFITVTNAIILKVRQAKTKRIRKNTVGFVDGQTHNNKRDKKLSILKTVKRSIKDIMVLNFWTVIFVLPQIPTGILFVISGEANPNMRGLVFLFFMINVLSNPVIYLLTQRDLRHWVMRHLVCTTSNAVASKEQQTSSTRNQVTNPKGNVVIALGKDVSSDN